MKILLSAFTCEPNSGSEPGLAWAWAFHLAKEQDITVFTQKKNKKRITKYLKEHPDLKDKVHFYFIAPPFGLEKIRKKLHTFYYLIWQLTLRFHLKKLLRKDPSFQLIHHVTYASFRYPIFLKKLGLPVIWGPIGGAEKAPTALVNYKGSLAEKLKEHLRNIQTQISVLLLPFLDPTQKGQNGIALAATKKMQEYFDQKSIPSRLFPSIGITPEERARASLKKDYPTTRPIRFLFIGRLHLLKGLQFALPALESLDSDSFHFDIVGSGSQRLFLEQEIKNRHLEKCVSLKGPHPWEKLSELYPHYDVLIAPSLYESGGMAVLEAMAAGLPAIVLNVGGPQLSVSKDCGFSIESTLKPQEVIQEIRQAVLSYMKNPALIKEHSLGALRKIDSEYLWEKKVIQMTSLYKEVLQSRPFSLKK